MPSERLLHRAMVVVLLLLSPLAHASPAGVTPTMIPGYPIIENPVFDGKPNTMMYDVTVKVSAIFPDAWHTAVVGFTDVPPKVKGACSAGPYKYSQPQAFDDTDTRTYTLYNFEPGTPYYYVVQIGAPGAYRRYCGELSSIYARVPTLPSDLDELHLEVTRAPGAKVHTNYVMLDTDDCGGLGYLVVLDTRTRAFVWYLDVAAAAPDLDSPRLSGWRYQPGPTSTSGRILAMLGKERVAEFGFDGSSINSVDSLGCDGTGSGPCFHHDAWKSDVTGKTYAVSTTQDLDISPSGTAWDDCSTSYFNDDGFSVLTATKLADAGYLMTDFDYDPTTDGGPREGTGECVSSTWGTNFEYDSIDWTHVNAVSSTTAGGIEVVDVSLKQWDQIVRINPITNEIVWRLSPYSDYTDMDIVVAPGISGEAGFGDQHDVHSDGDGHLLMLDNTGDIHTRVLRISFLDALGMAPPSTAVIDRSWPLVDADGTPLSCPIEGSAEIVPGTSGQTVLALCNAARTIAELSDSDGDIDDLPALVVSLPVVGACSGGVSPPIGGWYRAFPLATVGAF
jgi:hypothetical protein